MSMVNNFALKIFTPIRKVQCLVFKEILINPSPMEKRSITARADITKEWPELPNVHATQLSCNKNNTDLHTLKWPALVLHIALLES